MRPRKGRPPLFQQGFTIVELMIGLALGLMLTAVIVQVMTVFDAQTRTTTGTADAQTNGAIALYTIERDMQMVGYSLIPDTNSPLECTALNYGLTGITSISPLTITEGVASAGVNASDTITLRYGDSSKGGMFTQIGAGPAGNTVTAGTNLGCKVGNIALVTNGNNCALTRVTGPTDLATPPVPSSPPDTKSIILESVNLATPGANIACLGNWSSVTYSVSNGNLLRNGAPVLSGIVNLQAQYGVSPAPNSNLVTEWHDAIGAWAAPTLVDRNRIKAIRVAVIARSDRRDASTVSSQCSSTVAANPTGVCAWAGNATSPAPTVNLSTADADWQHYRYRTFETIIPLRNVIWSKTTF